MARAVAANLHRLDRSSFDVIVGIPRSGMLPASILATHLQMPLADPIGYSKGVIYGRSGKLEAPGQRVLLVDDTVNKGSAMARAAAMLPKSAKITRLCVYGPYQVEDPSQIVDIVFEDCRGPRAFGWNLWKHRRLPRWGFDFDGVLCRDNTKAENDDGPRYVTFLRDVEPLFIPQRPIGHIVTGRLEKYRGETEEWLARHGIQFEALHMTPFHSKAERMSAMKFAGGRGGWKARIVKDLGVEFFIESCPKQGAIIAREVGIPVWCTRTQALA
jgi:uncharacterized HAD superfamily protein